MNTMKWLLKREYWEHKGGFFWAPLVVGALLVVFFALSIVGGIALGEGHGVHINGAVIDNLSEHLSAAEKKDLAIGLASGYMGVSAPLFLVLAFVVFFFSLSSLFDERKDRSVLFWKSLPVSDTQTVLSKVILALGIAPLITLVLATITAGLALLSLCIGAAVMGLNLFPVVLSTPATYITPFQVLATLPVYILWALPTVGWLMLVSVWARTKPFLWAVGVPVLTGVLISWMDAIFNFNWNVGWFWQHIVGRGLGSVVPGLWFTFTDVGHNLAHDGRAGNDFGDLLAASWQTLGYANLWIGVVLGVAMIAAAIRLRRWRDEG